MINNPFFLQLAVCSLYSICLPIKAPRYFAKANSLSQTFTKFRALIFSRVGL